MFWHTIASNCFTSLARLFAASFSNLQCVKGKLWVRSGKFSYPSIEINWPFLAIHSRKRTFQAIIWGHIRRNNRKSGTYIIMLGPRNKNFSLKNWASSAFKSSAHEVNAACKLFRCAFLDRSWCSATYDAMVRPSAWRGGQRCGAAWRLDEFRIQRSWDP